MDSVKLWLFEAAAKRYGSYFEKTAVRDSGTFCIFSLGMGVQS